MLHEYLLALIFRIVRPFFLAFIVGQVPLIYLTKFMQGKKSGSYVFWLGLIIGPSIIGSCYLQFSDVIFLKTLWYIKHINGNKTNIDRNYKMTVIWARSHRIVRIEKVLLNYFMITTPLIIDEGNGVKSGNLFKGVNKDIYCYGHMVGEKKDQEIKKREENKCFKIRNRITWVIFPQLASRKEDGERSPQCLDRPACNRTRGLPFHPGVGAVSINFVPTDSGRGRAIAAVLYKPVNFKGNRICSKRGSRIRRAHFCELNILLSIA